MFRPHRRGPAMTQSAKVRQHDLEAKIRKIRGQLDAMKEYKRLIAADGISPDTDDKARESELIVRLLYFEKQLAGPKNGTVQSKSPARRAPAARPNRRGNRKDKKD